MMSTVQEYSACPACPTCILLRYKILHYAVQCSDHDQILEQMRRLGTISATDQGYNTVKELILKNVTTAFNATLSNQGKEHALLTLCCILDLLDRREDAMSTFIDHLFYYYPDNEFNALDRIRWCKTQVEKYSSYFPATWDIKVAILQRFFVLFRAEVDRLQSQMTRVVLVGIARPLASFEEWAGQEYRTSVLLKHYRKYMASKVLPDSLTPEDFFLWLKQVVSDMKSILPLSVGNANTINYIHTYLSRYAETGLVRTVCDLEYTIDMIGQLASFLAESFDTDKIVYIKRLEKMRNAIAGDINKGVDRIMTGLSFVHNRKKTAYLHDLEKLYSGLQLEMSDENKKLVMLTVCRFTISQFKTALLSQRSAINVEMTCTDYYCLQNIFNQPGFLCREELSSDMLDIQKIIMLLQHSLAPQTSYLEDFQQYSTDRNLFTKLLDLRGVKGRDRSHLIESYDRIVGTNFLQTILPFSM